ncbi:MAG: hypothetical protein LUD48_06450 [Prevotella sp.]|nr:hypothetical protein [Prevotella sp.]
MKKRILLNITCLLLFALSANAEVTITQSGNQTTMANGIIQFIIGTNGRISNLKLIGGLNVLSSNGIYFDYTGTDGNLSLNPSTVTVIKNDSDYAEVLYSNTSDAIQFQQGFILREGESGLYTYIIANGTSTSSSKKLQEARVCTRLGSNFLEGYVDDSMQGTIPSNDEMSTAEKNEIQDATYELSDGSIYTKYNWANYIVRDSVHGLTNGKTGVWNIGCSDEYVNGGPMRQELTVHATSKSPISIQMLQGEHFGASAQYFNEGEQKIYGPIFIYVNRGDSKEDMIADAKAMAHQKESEWPFSWFENDLYPLDRATVTGHLNVTTGQSNAGVQMILAEPGTDVYLQGKGYIFWGLTDENGDFEIKNVRKGDYTLYGYATQGDVTDELEYTDVTIDSETVDLGEIEWTPTCYENLLWLIGENNRMSDEFHYGDTCRFYGLWELPPSTLTYVVGQSDPAEDWYFAQSQVGTWTVQFDLDANYSGDALLTASIAGASNSPSVTVAINGNSLGKWSFYDDGSTRRSAVTSGRHSLYTFNFPGSYLQQGTNNLTLTYSGKDKAAVLYDCLKLEANGKDDTGITELSLDSDSKVELYMLNGIKVGTFNSIKDVNMKGVYIYRQGDKSGKINL